MPSTPTTPSPPRSLVAAPGAHGQVILTWLPPLDDGGAPIGGYRVQGSLNGATWTTIAESIGTVTSFTVSGLANGTRYYFRVSHATSRTFLSGRTLPAQSHDRRLLLRHDHWRRPRSFRSDHADVARPVVERRCGGHRLLRSTNDRSHGQWWTPINDGVSTATNYTVTGLTNGTPYYFQVIAWNGLGGGSPASNRAIGVPQTIPSAPRTLTAVPTNVSGQLRLVLAAPRLDRRCGDHGLQHPTLDERHADGQRSTTVLARLRTTSRRACRTGLATTSGCSPRTPRATRRGRTPANSIPRTKPSAPRSLTATPGNGRVTLRWLAPTSNGGAAVTDYVIQRYVSGGSWVTINDGVRTTTSYTVTGLRNGTRYYFRVFAKNAAGTGAASNTVNTIPRTVPSAPRLRAYPGSGRALLAWTPPTSNGGAAITRYVIQRSTSPTSRWAYVSTTTPATARSFTATGLRNGTRYYFRIAAVNAAGVGTWSPVISAEPSAVAGSGYYFPNCTAVRQAGTAPLQRTQPGYRTALDADRDGVACE